jgi:hypothetical protein
MLHEISSAGDVQHLAPAAHGEHRHVPGERCFEERELGAVALGADLLRLRMGLGAVRVGIEVAAAGEDDRVEHLQRLLDPVLDGRNEERSSAGLLDRTDVCERNERRRLRPCAPGRLLGVGRDPDHRPHRATIPSNQAVPMPVPKSELS